ncbi:peptidoglycan hydrolase-like protein with peptidoglycan-binding domain [Luteibacter sp. Sphag1AF]|uniref:peptidoglycan-binding domain-containing protein n=1 Tax=Luteibacter sp. Sphag1AF TaxID=2587031 RepID=UPI0016095710|nr:peptidoglycan-binding protein [Luteibacter sp. Sphag1AF]MBB3227121.1 peptidoglycan hydrolase-like protein with peptidoglycan-binding domain [Luteibacter sp. Sphag1AF]
MPGLDTHNAESLTGATYFVVGRGTEGGASSYHLSIAGVTAGTSDPNWGNTNKIVANSGYSLGTIQVDLGQRGTWALGSADGAKPKPGETTYVDGIIEQSGKYAKDHNLPFPQDTKELRQDLLSHGNGLKGRTTLDFIDTGTRDSINAWASSQDGQKWIHKNMDYPQVKEATQTAMDMLDKYGKNIPEDRRLETVAILAKTANQMPNQLKSFQDVMEKGGDYDAVLKRANDLHKATGYYDGPKAAAIAEEYKNAYKDPEKAAAMDRAHTKVGDPNFDPSKAGNDADIKTALKAVGQGGRTHAPAGNTLREGAHGEKVTALQNDLVKLGFTDAKGRDLHPDGDFGPGTKAAVEKFQRAHDMKVDGIVGPKTLEAVQKAAHPPQPSLADPKNPGNAMYNQALQNVQAIDAERGRKSDQMSNNLAGSLATAARAQGLSSVDHVVMSDDGKRAFAVQGDMNSPLKRIAEVNVAQSVAKPLEQSSSEFQQVSQQQSQQQANTQQQQQAPQQQQQQAPQQQQQPAQPGMH